MYRSLENFELLQWYANNKSNDGLIRHVVDSKAWAHINMAWPDFSHDLCNLRLAIATNGFKFFFKKLA
jgi:hypothetical protein